ncbi:MAG: hypothetical protein GTO41_25995 [Burkholderiales bacterium]|nr:hypothetical protein [Burkholderiales bacterium]
MFNLSETATDSNCNGVTVETVASLATTLQGNPRYTNEPIYNQTHQKMLAAVARQRGDYDAVVDHLKKAIAYLPAVDLNHMTVAALLRNGQFDAARDFIDDAQTLAPVHPVKAVMWHRDLDNLRTFVHDLAQSAGTQGQL